MWKGIFIACVIISFIAVIILERKSELSFFKKLFVIVKKTAIGSVSLFLGVVILKALSE